MVQYSTCWHVVLEFVHEYNTVAADYSGLFCVLFYIVHSHKEVHISTNGSA